MLAGFGWSVVGLGFGLLAGLWWGYKYNHTAHKDLENVGVE